MLAKANYYSEQVCNIALNLYAVIRFLKYLFFQLAKCLTWLSY